MKRIPRHAAPLTVLAALMLLGMSFGCAKSKETAGLQGKWVDVNGDTELEIKGDGMTIRWGGWTEEARFQTVEENGVTYLRNTQEDGYFGLMSDLRVQEDGSLSAYEMVLDAAGHSFRFVREEQKAALLEIEDLSTDAPKTIASKELERFSLDFMNNGGSYDVGKDWPTGRYRWEIRENGDGTYTMDFDVMGDSWIAVRFSEPVEEEYVRGLAALLEEQGIAAQNGYYKRNAVDRAGYELYAKYASGETLSVCADGDAAETCVFALRPLLDYAARQNLPGIG